MDLLLQSDAALDQDRSTMQFVIIALLIVAALLGLLTVWYWKQTDPTKSASTISGVSRYDDHYDDHYDDDYDDGYRAQTYSDNDGPTHLPGDQPTRRRSSADKRQPVVSHGSGRRSAPVQKPLDDDAWAAMTGAQNNESERF